MCVLRVTGENFAIEDFLKNSSLKPIIVFKKGEHYFKKTFSQSAGFNVSVSDKEFDDVEGQIKDAIVFLQREAIETKRLAQFPDIEEIELDFAISTPSEEIMVWSRKFPKELLSLLSASNIDLAFTVYPEAEK